MERAACTTSTALFRPPAQPRRSSRRQSHRHLEAPAPRQAWRIAALWSSSTGGSSTGGGGTPLAAALLAAVQVAAALQLAVALPAAADGGDFTLRSQAPAGDVNDDYFETVPQGLDSADSSTAPRLGALIEGPKGKQIQQCTRKCVPTCIRGGQGSPGLGPMSLRKEIIVFKEGYRSRSYCLSECTQVCALSINPPKPDAAK